MLTILSFLVVLTIVVFVHEMGHYLVARWCGIAIQTFSIGFGPEIVGFNDRHGTRWRISAIPLGGYVRFIGDMNPAGVPDQEAIASADPTTAHRLFVNKSVWQRIAVVVAGPAANVLLTFLLLYAMLVTVGRPITTSVVVDEVLAESVASAAGFLPGDRLTSVDGYTVRSFEDFARYVATAPERQVTIGLERAGAPMSLAVTPAATEITDRFGNNHRIGRIGVTGQSASGELYRPGPVEAVGMTLEDIRFIIDRTGAFLGDFFVGRGDVQQLGGPIKVAQVSGEAATLGFAALIGLVAMISLNIGIFNLLPIPLLDGGHLVFYLYEAVRGQPLSPRTQEWGFRLGLALVLTLTVFTLGNDLYWTFNRG